MMPSDPTLKKITRYVLFLHALCLVGILFHSALAPVKPKRKPLIVTTITPKVAVAHSAPAPKTSSPARPPSLPQPKPVKPQPSPAKPKPQIASPTKKPAPAAKPTPPTPKKEPAIADKQLKKKATPPKKENPPPPRSKISEELRHQLQESIAQIDGKKQSLAQQKNKPASKQLTPIQLHIDSLDGPSSQETESTYVGQMLSCLHQSLHLPEFGEVKIQLTLRQDGSIAKLVILNTESEKNRRYLESSLPKLRLPSFDRSLVAKAEQTFVLTFCNEI